MTVDGTIERTGMQRDKEQGRHYNLIVREPLRGLWIPSQIKMRTVNWTCTFQCISWFVHLFSSSYLSLLMWGSQYFFFQDTDSGNTTVFPKSWREKLHFEIWAFDGAETGCGWQMVERQLGYETGRQEAVMGRKKMRDCTEKSGYVYSASGGFTPFLPFAWASDNNALKIKCKFLQNAFLSALSNKQLEEIIQVNRDVEYSW